MYAVCVQESNVTTLHVTLLHGKHTKAIPLLERALSIRAKELGGDHPPAVTAPNNLEIIRQKVCAQLGCLVAQRHAQSVARRPDTARKCLPCGRCDDKSKKLRATAVTPNSTKNKSGGHLQSANCVTCIVTTMV
ncbi:unnamed protein product [Ectocarpus sp. 12 AP-2014]